MTSKKKFLVYLLAIFHLSLFGSPLHAAVFCVDDAADGLPNAPDCDADCNDGKQNCSLRDAIFASNGNGDSEIDDIVFKIPGAGPHQLKIIATLPSLNTPVNINGYSQPGSGPNSLEEGDNAVLLIELDGSGVAPAPGGLKLGVGSSGSAVSGLVMHGFTGANLFLDSSDNLITGNFIGTTLEGDTAGAGNAFSNGIFAQGSGNIIGGADPADRNIISGNQSSGIIFYGANAVNNAVLGNFIGTDSTGQQGLGNGYSGVEIASESGDNIIGGLTQNEGNIIAYNKGAGVVISGSGSGNSILGNSIFSNMENVSFGLIGLGIDLNDDNVTPNDLEDIDAGPNHLQNFPVLVSAERDAEGNIVIKGVLSGAPNADFRVELFANESCDPSGYGEGEKFIGALDPVSTGVDGVANFELSFLDEESAFLTATATDLSTGDTSEFSPCVEILPTSYGCDDGAGENPEAGCQASPTPSVGETDPEGHSTDCHGTSCQTPPPGFVSAQGGACALAGKSPASPNSPEALVPGLLLGVALLALCLRKAVSKN